jgi:lysozyme
VKTSTKGLIEITISEGLVPAPYIDAVGVWTFGTGHAETSGLEPNPRTMPRGMPITKTALATAIALSFTLFRTHLEVYEKGVDKALNVPVSQAQYDACVSLCFNIGTGGFGKSSVARHINSGDLERAGKSFLLWNKGTINGKKTVIAGLSARRAREKALFDTGRYQGGMVPVFGLNGDNTPNYRHLVRQLSPTDVAEHLFPKKAESPTVGTVEAPKGPGHLSMILALISKLFGGKT